MEGKDPNAVLAFLLGSTPSLNAAVDDPSNSDDDTPMLEAVTDSDEEDDMDAVTSYESEDENVLVAQRSTAKYHYQQVKNKRTSANEAEPEDDCGLKSEKPQKTVKDGNVPILEEILFVICVATVLIAYLIACVYSYFHPLSVPLPSYENLYSAYDISNVSVQIVNPVNNSQITPQGVSFEWKLVNFPVEALHLYGAEVYRYRISLDDESIASEVGFLALGKTWDNSIETFNRSIHFPIPMRRFERDDTEPFKLHLEVTIPQPGSIGELTTFEKTIFVRKPKIPLPENEVQLSITAPLDGAICEEDQSFVLEYTAVNVREMRVYLDKDVYFKKTHVEDGNLLMRGLSVKPHTLEIKAVDEQGKIIASSTVHVEIVKPLEPKAG